MKKILFQYSLGLLLLLPSFAFAAFNDVTLTTSTVLSVGGYTLNVTGSSAVIQSITVNVGNFTVTMLAGSHLQVSSPTFQQLTTDNPSLVSSSACSTGSSVLTLSSISSGTITVTPQSTICSTPASSGGSGGGGGGGNGPIVGSIGTLVAPTIATTSTPASAPATSSISSLQNEVVALTAELNTLLSQVHSATTPIPSMSTPASSSAFTFSRNLAMWDKGADVTALQEFLINQAASPAATKLKTHGSTPIFGILTYRALVEFQTKAGIVPASGFFGPITRAYVNGLKW